MRRELWPLLGVLQLPPTSLPCHTRLSASSGSVSWALPRLPPPHLLKEAFCEPSAPRAWHMVQAMVTLCRGQVALRRGRSLRAHCPHWVPGLLSHLALPPDHPHHQSPCWTPSFHLLSSLVGVVVPVGRPFGQLLPAVPTGVIVDPPPGPPPHGFSCFRSPLPDSLGNFWQFQAHCSCPLPGRPGPCGESQPRPSA